MKRVLRQLSLLPPLEQLSITTSPSSSFISIVGISRSCTNPGSIVVLIFCGSRPAASVAQANFSRSFDTLQEYRSHLTLGIDEAEHKHGMIPGYNIRDIPGSIYHAVLSHSFPSASYLVSFATTEPSRRPEVIKEKDRSAVANECVCNQYAEIVAVLEVATLSPDPMVVPERTDQPCRSLAHSTYRPHVLQPTTSRMSSDEPLN